MVFSAHAEVVPIGGGHTVESICILRARGGSSEEWRWLTIAH